MHYQVFTLLQLTPTFYRKGKIKAIMLMCKHERFINVFKCLGECHSNFLNHRRIHLSSTWLQKGSRYSRSNQSPL